MEKTVKDAGRQLRDYPISLRQSARAVFGSAYANAEKSAGQTALPGDTNRHG